MCQMSLTLGFLTITLITFNQYFNINCKEIYLVANNMLLQRITVLLDSFIYRPCVDFCHRATPLFFIFVMWNFFLVILHAYQSSHVHNVQWKITNTTKNISVHFRVRRRKEILKTKIHSFCSFFIFVKINNKTMKLKKYGKLFKSQSIKLL